MIDRKVFIQETSIERFLFAINNKLFVEAHELLEDDWKECKKNGDIKKAKVLKGLINGATALALYFTKHRPEGYKKVWPAFEKYIPLLDEVNFKNKEKYYEAKTILIQISNTIK